MYLAITGTLRASILPYVDICHHSQAFTGTVYLFFSSQVYLLNTFLFVSARSLTLSLYSDLEKLEKWAEIPLLQRSPLSGISANFPHLSIRFCTLTKFEKHWPKYRYLFSKYSAFLPAQQNSICSSAFHFTSGQTWLVSFLLGWSHLCHRQMACGQTVDPVLPKETSEK